MTVNRVRHERRAQKIAISCLNELLYDRLKCSADMPTGILGMIPVYSIPKHRLERHEYHHSWRCGWRYFWLHQNEKEGAIVDIVRLADGSAKLAQFSYGKSVVQLINALNEATSDHGGDELKFRPRILSLGSIKMEALWFNSRATQAPDYFYALYQTKQIENFVAVALNRYRAIESYDFTSTPARSF
jgi:hypothetical protein